MEARLPLRDPLETGLRCLARGDAILRDRLRDRRQRHQSRLGTRVVDVHFAAFSGVLAPCTRRNVAGSRSNGSVPATGENPSNAGPMELAMRAPTSGLTGTPVPAATAWIPSAVGLAVARRLHLP